ncbi:PQQ-binding-like beta-propeller repeat protein [Chloroflexota bacterium]
MGENRFFGTLLAFGIVFTIVISSLPMLADHAISQDNSAGNNEAAPWPMFLHNPQHTGRSPYTGPEVPEEKWSFAFQGWPCTSLVIGADGTIYVGSGDKKLYAVNPDGTEKWSFTTGGSIRSSPAISADGTIYVGSDDNKFYAVNPDGTEKWSFDTGTYVRSSPAIGSDSTIYCGSFNGNLYAINPDGSLKWTFATGDGNQDPAIGADGTIYVCSGGNKLCAVNPDGIEKWSFTTGGAHISLPAIGTDGTIYLGSDDKNLYAINTDGTLLWALATNDLIRTCPAIGADNTIYVGTDDGHLYAINPDGIILWAFGTGYWITSPPAIGADGTIYLGSLNGSLYAINPDGSLKWMVSTGGRYRYPAIGADGTIYITIDGTRYNVVDIKFQAIGEAPPLSPSFLEQTLTQDQAIGQTLTISNISTGDITWSLGENPQVEWLSATPTSGALARGEIHEVSITFDSTGLVPGDYTTVIEIASSDPDELYGVVPVTLHVIEGGLADTPWPMFHHDPQHTGRSPFTGPIVPWLKWSFDTGTYVRSSPAIGSDGTIYCGSFNGNLYAINPDGSLKWSFTTRGPIESSPAIGSDGTIYVGSGDYKLYAINPDGIILWAFGAGGYIHSSPVFGADGTIYVGSGDCKLYAINPSGTFKWGFATGGPIESSPAIGADGTIYVGSDDKKLYAVNPDGIEIWSFTTGGPIESSPAIGADGTIYVGSGDNKFYAVSPDGSTKWLIPIAGPIESSPAIGSDGTIYFGSWDGNLYGINPNGNLKWSYTTLGPIESSPAIGSDGTIYVGSGDKKLYAVNPDGTLNWSSITGGPIESSPAIGADGTIYIGPGDNKLYAIAEGLLQADFTATPNVGVAPLSVQFADQSTGNITYWQWDFGDGQTIDEQNPIYSYAAAGVYTVSLTVNDPGGSDTEARIDYITVYEMPQADFTATPTVGVAPLSVQFADQSTGNVAGWQWDFDNDDVVDSIEQNPSHSYVEPGTYTVSLIISNPATSDTEVKLEYISVYAAPQADFFASLTQTVVGQTIEFADQSTGNITYWQWDFGDGQTIDEQNPIHSYAAAGVYTVSLTVTGPGGSDTEARIDYISVIVALTRQTITPDTECIAQTPDERINVRFPVGAVNSETEVIIRECPMSDAPSAPSRFKFGDACFNIDGVTTLAKEITITVKYSEEDIAVAGGDPNLLMLARYNDDVGEWVILPTMVDTIAQNLIVTTDELSLWVILIKEPLADLSVIIGDSPDPVIAGNDLTYTVEVTNSGPDATTGVVVTDTLPAGVTFVSATPTQGSCSTSDGTVTCTMGNLGSGTSATVTIIVTPTTARTLKNAVSVTSNESDPDTENNMATENTTVNTTVNPTVNPTAGFSIGAIIGIVVGVAVFIGGVLLYLWRRGRRSSPR